MEKIFPSPLFSGADLENDLVAAALIKSSSPRVPLLDLLDGLIDSLMEILGDFGNAEANSTKPASLVSIPWTGFGVVTNWKAVSSPNFNEHLAARERAEQKFRPWLRGLTYNSAGKVSSSGLVGCAALILRELAISSENIPMMCPSASKGIQPLLGTKNVVPQTSAGSSQPSDPSLAEVGGNETADEATDDMDTEDGNSRKKRKSLSAETSETEISTSTNVSASTATSPGATVPRSARTPKPRAAPSFSRSRPGLVIALFLPRQLSRKIPRLVVNYWRIKYRSIYESSPKLSPSLSRQLSPPVPSTAALNAGALLSRSGRSYTARRGGSERDRIGLRNRLDELFQRAMMGSPRRVQSAQNNATSNSSGPDLIIPNPLLEISSADASVDEHELLRRNRLIRIVMQRGHSRLVAHEALTRVNHSGVQAALNWISTHPSEVASLPESSNRNSSTTSSSSSSISNTAAPVSVSSSSSVDESSLPAVSPSTSSTSSDRTPAPTSSAEENNSRESSNLQVPSEITQFPSFMFDLISDIIRPLTAAMYLPSDATFLVSSIAVTKRAPASHLASELKIAPELKSVGPEQLEAPFFGRSYDSSLNSYLQTYAGLLLQILCVDSLVQPVDKSESKEAEEKAADESEPAASFDIETSDAMGDGSSSSQTRRYSLRTRLPSGSKQLEKSSSEPSQHSLSSLLQSEMLCALRAVSSRPTVSHLSQGSNTDGPTVFLFQNMWRSHQMHSLLVSYAIVLRVLATMNGKHSYLLTEMTPILLSELELLVQTASEESRLRNIHPLRSAQKLAADALFSLLPSSHPRSQIFQVSHFMLSAPPPAAVTAVYNRASFICLLLEMIQNQIFDLVRPGSELITGAPDPESLSLSTKDSLPWSPWMPDPNESSISAASAIGSTLFWRRIVRICVGLLRTSASTMSTTVTSRNRVGASVVNAYDFGFIPHLESLNSLIMSVVNPLTLSSLANTISTSDPKQALVHAPAFFEHRSIDPVALCAPAALSCLLQLISRVLRFQPSLVGSFLSSSAESPPIEAIVSQTAAINLKIPENTVSVDAPGSVGLPVLPSTDITEQKSLSTVSSPQPFSSLSNQARLLTLFQSLCHTDRSSDAAVFDLLRHELEHPALLQVAMEKDIFVTMVRLQIHASSTSTAHDDRRVRTEMGEHRQAITDMLSSFPALAHTPSISKSDATHPESTDTTSAAEKYPINGISLLASCLPMIKRNASVFFKAVSTTCEWSNLSLPGKQGAQLRFRLKRQLYQSVTLSKPEFQPLSIDNRAELASVQPLSTPVASTIPLGVSSSPSASASLLPSEARLAFEQLQSGVNALLDCLIVDLSRSYLRMSTFETLERNQLEALQSLHADQTKLEAQVEEGTESAELKETLSRVKQLITLLAEDHCKLTPAMCFPAPIDYNLKLAKHIQASSPLFPTLLSAQTVIDLIRTMMKIYPHELAHILLSYNPMDSICVKSSLELTLYPSIPEISTPALVLKPKPAVVPSKPVIPVAKKPVVVLPKTKDGVASKPKDASSKTTSPKLIQSTLQQLPKPSNVAKLVTTGKRNRADSSDSETDSEPDPKREKDSSGKAKSKQKSAAKAKEDRRNSSDTGTESEPTPKREKDRNSKAKLKQKPFNAKPKDEKRSSSSKANDSDATESDSDTLKSSERSKSKSVKKPVVKSSSDEKKKESVKETKFKETSSKSSTQVKLPSKSKEQLSSDSKTANDSEATVSDTDSVQLSEKYNAKNQKASANPASGSSKGSIAEKRREKKVVDKLKETSDSEKEKFASSSTKSSSEKKISDKKGKDAGPFEETDKSSAKQVVKSSTQGITKAKAVKSSKSGDTAGKSSSAKKNSKSSVEVTEKSKPNKEAKSEDIAAKLVARKS